MTQKVSNAVYEYVFRFFPSIMFILMTIILLTNAFLKYKITKKIINCVYLEIPFRFCLKALFGLEKEFAFLEKSQEYDSNNNKITNNKNQEDGIENAVIEKETVEADNVITNKGKQWKLIKFYLQLIVHSFFTIITLSILFLHILLFQEEIEDKCLEGYDCFGVSSLRETINCNSTAKNLHFVCQKYDIKSFESLITDLGAFAGIVTIIFKGHKFTFQIILFLKSKLRALKISKSVNNRLKSSNLFEKILFIFLIVLEFLILISLLIMHGFSKQLKIEFLLEEYLIYGCLL